MAVKKKTAKRKAAPRTAASGKVLAADKSARKAPARKVPAFESLQQIALEAHRKLSPAVWDHLMGGADSEMTLRRNRAGLDALALRQRVLVDVRNIDMSTSTSTRCLSASASRPARLRRNVISESAPPIR